MLMDCPKKAEGIEISEIEGGYMAYQRDRDKVHYLNNTAVLVLELCNGNNTGPRIAELVHKAYGLPDDIYANVEEIIAMFRKENLVG
jgi:hypothetical protein